MLSFTPYIFSVIAEGETTGLYVTGLYVPACRERLPIAGLEIKRRMALIVNKSNTRIAREELRNNFTKTYSTRRSSLQEALISSQMMMANKRLLYEFVHISAEVCLLS